MATVYTVFSLNIAAIDGLPSRPANLLVMGQDTAGTVDGLLAQGYSVTEVPLFKTSSDGQFRADKYQDTYKPDVADVMQNAQSAEFEGALVLGLSPQVHPLALFHQLYHHISQGGVVLLMGQTSDSDPPRVSRWLEFFVAIGARCGFTALEQSAEISSAGDGAIVMGFRKTTVPRWQLRNLTSNDYPEVAELFQEVFGYPISPELWAWKYADRRGNAVLASRDGVLVAHYGGMYRKILMCGKLEWAYGGSDVMVHPSERGVMTRRGPFFLTAATTAELYGPVAFGFPTERAMLVAEKMGLYTKAGQMAEIRWEPGATRFRLGTRVRPLRRGNLADQELVDELWEAMATDLQDSVVGVRDWKFLEYRYFGHPHNRYEVLAVTSRWTGKGLGIMVLRRLEGSCELLDVIAPLGNLEIVLDQARRMTARWALPYLYCWITTNQAQYFVACGGKLELLNMFIPTSCWTDDPRVNMLIDKWWLMSGDTDFR